MEGLTEFQYSEIFKLERIEQQPAEIYDYSVLQLSIEINRDLNVI